jgi:predicted Zn-dependent protease
MTQIMKLLRHILLPWTILALLLAAAVAQQKTSNAKDDVVLSALRAELDRSKSQLKMDQVALPYYVEYRIFDVDQYVASASFGALRADMRTRFRFLRVVVRIGDYKQDSYFGQGEGTLDYMPVDDDMLALRHQLWLATDRAYKSAAESLTAKQAQLKQMTIDEPVDDFAHADPVQSIGPLVKLDFDPEPWKKMLQDASALYKNDPQIESFDASLHFQAVNRYLVNSEGTEVRSGQNLYEMSVGCSTQAADGMSLARDNAFTGETMKELPTAADFVARGAKLADSLKDLRNAPLVEEDYRGPVLFSADASTAVFSSFVGENVLGHKPELGKNSRTTGAFASSYKTRVLPDFISVISDPTISEYRGQALLGHYAIDDEGVPAKKVSVIEKGVLVNYLLGREPIRDFPASNGHARAQIPTGSPAPHNSNLIVSASQTTPKDELKKKLIEQCKQRDLAYCYYVETFGGRLTPRLLYKVWTKDGHEELVRGAVLGDLDIRSLRSDVSAAGDDFYVDNRPQTIPNSIVAPSILIDELEVKRANQNKEKLPEYPAPDVIK